MAADLVTPALAPDLVTHGQLALAPSGPQRFYARTQRALERGAIVARLDIRNAFGCAHRAATISALRARMPGMAPLPRAAAMAIEALYATSERVLARTCSGPTVLQNSRGVIQGCAAGSLLFATLVADALRDAGMQLERRGIALRPMHDLAHSAPLGPSEVAFLALHDDVSLAANTAPLLESAMGVVAAAFERVGLAFGAKSTLVLSDAVEVPGTLESLFPAGRTDCTVCAGGPLWAPGARDAAARALREAAVDALAPLEALTSAHPQDGVRVLRLAGPSTRLQYLASLTHTFVDAWDAIDSEADELVRRLLGHALGGDAPATSRLSRLAAFAPAAQGGLGIPSPYVERALAALQARGVTIADDPTLGAEAAREHDETIERRRRALYGLLGELLALTTEGDLLHTVRRVHQARPEVAALWGAPAAHRDRTFVAAPIASRLLASALHAPMVHTSQPYGEVPAWRAQRGEFGEVERLGPKGDEAMHVHTCPRGKTRRHNRVRDALADVADSVAHGHVLLEQGIDDAGAPVQVSRAAAQCVPGDLVIRRGRTGKWSFFDVTVVFSRAGAVEEAALAASGQHALRMVERANASKHAGRCQGAVVLSKGADYHAIGVSAFGAYDRSTKGAVEALAGCAASHSSVPPALGEPGLHTRMLTSLAFNARVGDATLALEYDPPSRLAGAASEPFRADDPLESRLRAAMRAADQDDFWAVRSRWAVVQTLGLQDMFEVAQPGEEEPRLEALSGADLLALREAFARTCPEAPAAPASVDPPSSCASAAPRQVAAPSVLSDRASSRAPPSRSTARSRARRPRARQRSIPAEVDWDPAPPPDDPGPFTGVASADPRSSLDRGASQPPLRRVADDLHTPVPLLAEGLPPAGSSPPSRRTGEPRSSVAVPAAAVLAPSPAASRATGDPPLTRRVSRNSMDHIPPFGTPEFEALMRDEAAKVVDRCAADAETRPPSRPRGRLGYVDPPPDDLPDPGGSPPPDDAARRLRLAGTGSGLHRAAAPSRPCVRGRGRGPGRGRFARRGPLGPAGPT